MAGRLCRLFQRLLFECCPGLVPSPGAEPETLRAATEPNDVQIHYHSHEATEELREINVDADGRPRGHERAPSNGRGVERRPSTDRKLGHVRGFSGGKPKSDADMALLEDHPGGTSRFEVDSERLRSDSGGSDMYGQIPGLPGISAFCPRLDSPGTDGAAGFSAAAASNGGQAAALGGAQAEPQPLSAMPQHLDLGASSASSGTESPPRGRPLDLRGGLGGEGVAAPHQQRSGSPISPQQSPRAAGGGAVPSALLPPPPVGTSPAGRPSPAARRGSTGRTKWDMAVPPGPASAALMRANAASHSGGATWARDGSPGSPPGSRIVRSLSAENFGKLEGAIPPLPPPQLPPALPPSAAPTAALPASPTVTPSTSLSDCGLTPPTTPQKGSALAGASPSQKAAAALSGSRPPPVVPPPMAPAELSRRLAALTNRNRVSEYEWVALLLAAIAANAARPVEDLGVPGLRGTPLFVVCGACPNPFCGMQAVLYSLMAGGGRPASMDFWWIKPQPSAPTALEAQTLNRHPKGQHKNDPGRSRALYAQFADLFALDGSPEALARSRKSGGGKLTFGVLPVGDVQRAYVEQVATGERYFIYLIWQEDWTANPFARSKFIKGKLVYQRQPTSPVYFARPYGYRDGVLSVPAEGEEEAVGSVLPPDEIKLGCIEI